jgi:peptidyl-prolyl cis-trans isomerase SurA
MNFKPISYLLGACALALLSALPVAAADEAERVAAVVNDDIISIHDLDQRLKLVLLSSNLADTVETRSRVMPQVLHRLIDEHLELQEAEKQKVAVDSGEIATAIANIEHQNRMPRGSMEKMLRQRGVDPETLRQQVRADLAWSDTVHQELTRDIRVGDDAVNTRLANLKANLGKPEYLAGEIFLAVEGPRNDNQVQGLAERLIEQLRQGAPFQALAQQFSQNGGALSRLQVNTVTPPIRTNDGYHILILLDKRKIGDGLSSGPSVDLLTIELTSLPSATFPERDAQLQRFKDTLGPVKGCDELERVSKTLPSTTYNRVERISEAGLPPEVMSLIGKLDIGQLSEPLDLINARRFFAVCGRHNDEANGLPSYDDIKHRMEAEQLENLARRYLRDIRRNAYVDVRI